MLSGRIPEVSTTLRDDCTPAAQVHFNDVADIHFVVAEEVNPVLTRALLSELAPKLPKKFVRLTMLTACAPCAFVNLTELKGFRS